MEWCVDRTKTRIAGENTLRRMRTRSCAAKPYGWHGGQPAQAATYRVNLRGNERASDDNDEPEQFRT